MLHKKFLNDWFTGRYPGSPSRGELYNDDPRLGDARLCGTTASLCGVERTEYEQDPFLLERALSCNLAQQLRLAAAGRSARSGGFVDP